MARAVKLTILIISFVASISQSCPIPADILPCTCFEDSLSRLSLTCFGIESENQLQTIFQASFPEKAFYDLYVDESPGLLSIGPIFNGVTFEVVELYRSGIQSITDDALLTSSATLTKLILKDTAIETSSFPFSTLQSYPNLEVLTIDTSNIDAIPSLQSDSLQNLGIVASNVQTLDMSTFSGLPSITGINLEMNAIQSLQPGVFSGVNTLTSINLSENQIEVLEPLSFEFNDAGSSLYIWNNNLSFIDPQAFVLPPTLDSFSLFLDLGSNELTFLDEAAFAPLFPYLEFLFIAGNPLECGCDIAWLVINQEWMGKIGNTAECADGRRLVDLDPVEYEANC